MTVKTPASNMGVGCEGDAVAGIVVAALGGLPDVGGLDNGRCIRVDLQGDLPCDLRGRVLLP